MVSRAVEKKLPEAKGFDNFPLYDAKRGCPLSDYHEMIQTPGKFWQFSKVKSVELVCRQALAGCE